MLTSHLEMPISPDLAIAWSETTTDQRQRDKTDSFTPCACAQGNFRRRCTFGDFCDSNEVSLAHSHVFWLEVTMRFFSLNWNPFGDSDAFLPTERQSEGSILNALADVGLCSSPRLSQSGGSIL